MGNTEVNSIPAHVPKRALGGLGSHAGLIFLGATIGAYVAFAPELVGYGSLRATAGIACFLGFVVAGTLGPGIQLAYFIGVSPLLVFLEQGQLPFQMNETLRLIMLAILTFHAVGHSRFRAVLARPESRLFIAFFLWCVLLTTFYAIDAYVGFAVLVRHSSDLLLLIIVPVLADRDTIRRWIIPIVLLTTVGAMTAGLGMAAADLAAGRLSYGMGGTYRATGVFESGAPNAFAVYLTSVTLFAVSYVWMGRAGTRVKLATIVPFLGALGLILFSFSRRALLALGFGIVLMLLLMRGLRQRMFPMIGLAIAVLVVLVAVPLEVILNPRVLALLDALGPGGIGDAAPAARRLGEWEGISEHIFRSAWSLLIGVQPGAASLFATRFLGIRLIPRMDNYYVSLTADYGLIALILYLGVVITVWVRLLQSTRGDHPDRPIVVGALVAMSVILISGLVGNTNMTFPNSMYLWLLPALGLKMVESGSDGAAAASHA